MTQLKILANIYIEDKTPTGMKKDKVEWGQANWDYQQFHRTQMIQANANLLHVISQMQNMTDPIRVDKNK